MFKTLVCALLLTLTMPLALAEGPPKPGDAPRAVADTDARAIRAVVEGQLKALAADDAVQAFSHASTAIQKQFRDAATFARMVRTAYPMLIRPASTSFYRPLASGPVITQSVRFRDAEGKSWRADYLLQRQPDERWRIEGCQVMPADEASTT